ncbi:MAG: Holliday junction resolvase RuvX [Candidatus Omnitrophota bacterium]
MGLDIGTKNIGVALSDGLSIIAQGKEVIKRTDDSAAIARIEEIVDEFRVKEIIVGLPVNMNGTMGPRAEDSSCFAEKLKKKTALSVKMWDERLSTKEVEAVLIKGSVSRKKRKRIIDKLAAQIILQGYLDSK